MKDGHLKESQNRHPAGPGQARDKSSLEKKGHKAEASAAGAPVVAAPVSSCW